MHLVGTTTITLLAVSLASVSYTHVSAGDIEQTASGVASPQEPASSTAQDQTKPPAHPPKEVPRPTPKQTPPPKATSEARPPKSEKQEPTPKQQEKEQKDHQKHNQEQSKQQQKQQKTAGKNARIPDRDFKAHFGQAHTFRAQQVITTTRVIPNQTRFVYAAYTFIFVDPWPPEWLLTDDCYIDDIDDEFFLLDPLHPGIRVALVVVV